MTLLSVLTNPLVTLGLGAVGTLGALRAAVVVAKVKSDLLVLKGDLVEAKAKVVSLEQKLVAEVKKVV
jgi:hypothetical protein